MSRSELVALVKRMLERSSELEGILDLPLPGAVKTRPVDPRQIHRQVRQVIRASKADYEEERIDILQEISPILDLADSYLEAQDRANAAIIYQETIQAILEDYEDAYDEEGEVAGVVDTCVSDLGECLEQTQDNSLRKSILNSLWEVALWDTRQGGLGLGDEAPELIYTHATAPEKRLVADWVRTALLATHHNFEREALGGFLLKLEEDTLDDDTYLRICRETGRTYDLVDRLLLLNRIPEALKDVEAVSDFELLHMADLFIQHGQDALAEQLVTARSKVSKDSRLLTWRKDRAHRQGNLAEALGLAEQLFWQRPSLTTFLDIKALALQTGNWPEIRRPILSHLDDLESDDLLTQIYIDKKDIDLAEHHFERFRKKSSHPYWWEGSHLDIALAEAAETTHPSVAMRLYLNKVYRLIGWRGRGNYAAAASLLLRVKHLFEGQNNNQDWLALITQIRSENPRLSALEDELNQARL
jgi:hypothetical protein